MIKRVGLVFRCLLVLSLFFYSWRLVSLNGVVSAHSGRTDSSGGHNCNVGSCAGTYHYHNGGYTPPAVKYVPTPTFPLNTKASTIWTSNSNKTYDVVVKLNDVNPTQYSAVISKCKGCNPGPSTDFYNNKFKFNNVSPGVWYVNVKKEISGRWSTVVYWTIDVPAWAPPTPTPKPVAAIKSSPVLTPPVSSSDDSGFIFIIITISLLCLIYVGYRVAKWFLVFAKENDWVYGTLIWIAIIGGILIFGGSDDQKRSLEYEGIKKSNYTCDCSKTCPNLSCEEAYYQLNSCGCSVRDGDGDGVPCEAQCR